MITISQKELLCLRITSEMDSENEGQLLERKCEHISVMLRTWWLKTQALKPDCLGSNPGSTLYKLMRIQSAGFLKEVIKETTDS